MGRQALAGKGRCCQADEPGTVQDGTAWQNVSRSPPTNYYEKGEGHIQRGEGRITTRPEPYLALLSTDISAT